MLSLKSITFAQINLEGWQSDRLRWTRNPVYPFGYRGFESLTFRKWVMFQQRHPTIISENLNFHNI